MAKAGEVIGKSLVVRDGGRAVGKVKDVVVDESGKRVLGFVVSEGLLKSTKVALYASVQSIGPDSVVVATEEGVVKAAQAPEINTVLEKNLKIRGVKVQTTTGKDLGVINDMEFEEATGTVVGYELSGGLFSNVFGGRSYLPAPASIELGKDLAFVGPEAEETIRKRSED
jgi:uncharacterized protein YrrD